MICFASGSRTTQAIKKCTYVYVARTVGKRVYEKSKIMPDYAKYNFILKILSNQTKETVWCHFCTRRKYVFNFQYHQQEKN